jgi:SAM-dependent methyltransferase
MVAAPARFPAVHERVLTPYELALLQPKRQHLLGQARGVVLDLGGGTGAHFSWYPTSVTKVIVLGTDPFTRSVVARRAARAAMPVTLVDSLDETDVAAAAVDTVVAQLVLCAIPALDTTLASVAKLMAPSGRFLFCEHVPPRGEPGFVRSVARPFWRTLSAGCDLTRDVPAAVRTAGFTITDLERFRVPTLTPPLRTCAVGVARLNRTSEP